MKKTLGLFLIAILFNSCKEEKSYDFRLLIENNTENKISVKLYPRSEYMHNSHYDDGNGDGQTELSIEPNEKSTLYYSSIIDQKPYDLATSIFDSIHITPFDQDTIVMKFAHDKVVGYTENLFDSTSTWDYEKKNYNMATSFRVNSVESNEYNFVISADKY